MKGGRARFASRRSSLAARVACGSTFVLLLAAFGGSAASAAENSGGTADLSTVRQTRQANAALDRLLGFWEGEGEFQGTIIREEFRADRTLDGMFVRIETREEGGAEFESDMYVGWDPVEGRYELFFFSNFAGFGPELPARVMYGYRSGNKLVFEERRTRPLPRRFTFEFLDDETFVLTKIIYAPTVELLSTAEFVRQEPVFRGLD